MHVWSLGTELDTSWFYKFSLLLDADDIQQGEKDYYFDKMFPLLNESSLLLYCLQFYSIVLSHLPYSTMQFRAHTQSMQKILV